MRTVGVEHFAKDSPILASSNSPSFLAPSNLPTNSLCLSLSIPTPKYNPILIDHLSPIVSPNTNLPLGMIALHTPGHTPDSLSLWDEEDRMLYVGDTLYEKEPIIFPKEGSIIIWFEKLDYLIDLVQSKPFADDIKVSCGHTTASRPALEVFRKTKGFMQDVIAERIPVKTRTKKRGEVYVEYVQTEMDLSLICPERLVLEARNSGYAV
ncbi:hypothetical protein JAAARDRAFT_131469 [Jaapia argillacea MUCL 33604]|uniref:Metallo-beta-lactamase domain-containing protein n=1 Tax=Jaapia argillacea MUCL 33604 TaxID=933084 RepID=A0A067PQZ3_9AGAM|nr:hypothetical protein JAAARDRAFT_131469 [Jaapia argillacea MUCL 33604]